MADAIFLDCFVDGSRGPQRIELTSFPVRIGRGTDCQVHVDTSQASRQHAEIRRGESDPFELHDLESTNGTYVNGDRVVGPVAIFNADIIGIGEREFRLVIETPSSDRLDDGMTRVGVGSINQQFATRVREFNQLLDEERVQGVFQPIMDSKGHPFGFELLGRGNHPDLDASPVSLFALARTQNAEVRLSELFRRTGFAQAKAAGLETPVFFNTHPAECRDPDHLIAELRALRERYPGLKLVFEVHEAAVTDLSMMAEIRAELHELGIELAYDDFGAGQARLLELVEVPPDYLKFDIALVAGIAAKNSPRRRMLQTLNRMIQDMGVQTLAEGVETEAIANACMEIGVDYMQGYYYGRPEAIG